jgi:hypothetical protein
MDRVPVRGQGSATSAPPLRADPEAPSSLDAVPLLCDLVRPLAELSVSR